MICRANNAKMHYTLTHKTQCNW